MAEIDIYSTSMCPYCVAAKRLLDAKGVAWREYRIDLDPAARQAMLERVPGARTVPQIFVNGVHIGGFEQLVAAERNGKLQELLQAMP